MPGAITGPADPEARFCACLIRDFGAAYTGPPSADSLGPVRLTLKHQSVSHVDRLVKSAAFLQKDLDDMAGLKDTKQGRNGCRIWI
jgi:hypothetical protein